MFFLGTRCIYTASQRKNRTFDNWQMQTNLPNDFIMIPE